MKSAICSHKNKEGQGMS